MAKDGTTLRVNVDTTKLRQAFEEMSRIAMGGRGGGKTAALAATIDSFHNEQTEAPSSSGLICRGCDRFYHKAVLYECEDGLFRCDVCCRDHAEATEAGLYCRVCRDTPSVLIGGPHNAICEECYSGANDARIVTGADVNMQLDGKAVKIIDGYKLTINTTPPKPGETVWLTKKHAEDIARRYGVEVRHPLELMRDILKNEAECSICDAPLSRIVKPEPGRENICAPCFDAKRREEAARLGLRAGASARGGACDEAGSASDDPGCYALASCRASVLAQALPGDVGDGEVEATQRSHQRGGVAVRGAYLMSGTSRCGSGCADECPHTCTTRHHHREGAHELGVVVVSHLDHRCSHCLLCTARRREDAVARRAALAAETMK